MRWLGQFSAPAFTAGLGAQGELMFDAALPTVVLLAHGTQGQGARRQGMEGRPEHDLDRVFERDGILHMAQTIKNTLEIHSTGSANSEN